MHNIGEILPHAVLYRSTLRLSSVILSQHMSRHKPWCLEMCPRVASIGKCRAPRVNDDTLSARHCVTECIYSIYPGTKVWGSSTGHRSWRWPACSSKQAVQLSWLLTGISSLRSDIPLPPGISRRWRLFPYPCQEGPYKA